MRKIGDWVVMEKRETVDMTVIVSTLTSQEKHFMEDQYRSYLCSGADCSYCRRKVPKRTRYQVQVMVDGIKLWWEFTEEVFNTISRLAPVDGLLDIVVRRLGDGRKSRYQISEQEVRLAIKSRFQRGKYGHMVQG